MDSGLSIVIPVYNGESTLEKCLSSIFASEGAELKFEVIVVDDGCADGSMAIAEQFPCRIKGLERNMGISAARNAGAREANTEIIYFVDADIVQKPETIGMFIKAFDEDPELVVAQAVWAKEALNPSFGGDFWALKTYYLIKIRQLGDVEVRKDAKSFNSGCLCIKRNVFWAFGGFDERYTCPGGEEHLLAFQMSQEYPLYQYKDIEVNHHFARAWPKVKIQFGRATRLGSIFWTRPAFSAVGSTTKGEATRCALACDVVPFLIIALFFAQALWIAGALFVLFVLSGYRFYAFLSNEKGAAFSFAGIFYDFLLYFATGLGISIGLAGFLARKAFRKREEQADGQLS